jgi:hypothetical protein
VKAVDAEKNTITIDDKAPAEIAGKTFAVAPESCAWRTADIPRSVGDGWSTWGVAPSTGVGVPPVAAGGMTSIRRHTGQRTRRPACSSFARKCRPHWHWRWIATGPPLVGLLLFREGVG